MYHCGYHWTWLSLQNTCKTLQKLRNCLFYRYSKYSRYSTYSKYSTYSMQDLFYPQPSNMSITSHVITFSHQGRHRAALADILKPRASHMSNMTLLCVNPIQLVPTIQKRAESCLQGSPRPRHKSQLMICPKQLPSKQAIPFHLHLES